MDRHEIDRYKSLLRKQHEAKAQELRYERRSEMELSGKTGVGIRGMRERVRQLGGTLEINSLGDGAGTTIVSGDRLAAHAAAGNGRAAAD